MMADLFFINKYMVSLHDAVATRWGYEFQGVKFNDFGRLITETVSDENGLFNDDIRIKLYPWENNLEQSDINADWIFDRFRLFMRDCEFRFEFYKNDELVSSFETERLGKVSTLGSGAELIFEDYFFDARHFDRLDIVFTKTFVPLIEGSISDLEFRVIHNIIKVSKFRDLKIKEAINILSDDVPINSCECEIVVEEEFPLKGFPEFDIENNGEYFGRFYVENFKKVGEKIYSISANSILGKTDNYIYDEWQSKDYTIRPRVLPEQGILEATGIGVVAEDVSFSKPYSGHIESNTGRYAICQLAWAQGLMVDESRRSFVALKPVPSVVNKNRIENNRIINDSVVEKGKEYSNAVYRVYEYLPESMEQKEILKINGSIAVPQKVYFSNSPSEIGIDFSEGYLQFAVSPSSVEVISFSDNFVELQNNSGNVEEVKVYGVELKKVVKENIINNRFETYLTNNILNLSKFTLHAIDDEGEFVDIKSNDIRHIVESQGVLNCKIVLQGERVGDLVDIQTAFDGVVRGIITSLQYKPSSQMIADVTIKLVSIGYEPLQAYSESGELEYVYDKFGDPIFVLAEGEQ